MISNLSAKNIKLIERVFRTSWQVRPVTVVSYFVGAILEIGSFIVTIYASARLAGLLAQFATASLAPTPQSVDVNAIWFWLWVGIAAAGVSTLSFWLMRWCQRLLHFRIATWATNEYQSALCRLDIADFQNKGIRDQITKAEGGYDWQMSNLAQSTLELIYGILRFVATAFIVAQISWWIIPLLSLFLVPSLFAEARQAKLQWMVWGSKGDERYILVGLGSIIRRVQNQMELRSTQARQYVLGRIRTINEIFYRKQEEEMRRASYVVVPSKLLEVAGTAIASIAVLRQFLTESISLERYFFLSGALLRVSSALSNIFGTLSRMQEQLLFAENFFAIIDRHPSLIDRPDAFSLNGSKTPMIVFNNVGFTYPGQTQPVFENLSFTIAAGEHVAIVGENGAGKTTLIKLLLRFYPPDHGRITIDGHDLQDIAIESWYEQLATLFQEFNQYPFSIAENIEVARPEHAGNEQRRRTVAQLSNVDKMIKGYRHGWETVLDQSFAKGVEPSGGQWQRVALARAFYRQANVLILDEPTAAIDARAEYEIFNSIFKHYHNKTAIIVSHRFSTVRRANTIIVISRGHIVEKGAHATLMRHKGLYHELFTKQAEGYQN